MFCFPYIIGLLLLSFTLNQQGPIEGQIVYGTLRTFYPAPHFHFSHIFTFGEFIYCYLRIRRRSTNLFHSMAQLHRNYEKVNVFWSLLLDVCTGSFRFTRKLRTRFSVTLFHNHWGTWNEDDFLYFQHPYNHVISFRPNCLFSVVRDLFLLFTCPLCLITDLFMLNVSVSPSRINGKNFCLLIYKPT